VLSQPGTGSLFWIELRLPETEARGVDLTEEFTTNAKLQSTAQSIAAARSGKVRKLRGARVLVAEDNPTNQRVAQLILESGGHVATIVDNGEAALDALERGGFDLALFDLSMPVVSGLEALKLYRFASKNPIPILILSANVTTEAILESENAGAAEFIPKPLRASYLLEAIERHVAGQVENQMTPAPPLRTDDRPTLSLIDTPPLDLAIVKDLARISSDSTFVGRLIRGFHSDTERLVNEMTDAISHRRYEAVKDAAHALRGGAASVGAVQLTRLAGRLEKASHDALRIKAAQWIEELQQTARRTLAELDQYITDPQADQASPKPGA
jgi:two-component system sensor histidine kinase RpfC